MNIQKLSNKQKLYNKYYEGHNGIDIYIPEYVKKIQ